MDKAAQVAAVEEAAGEAWEVEEGEGGGVEGPAAGWDSVPAGTVSVPGAVRPSPINWENPATR